MALGVQFHLNNYTLSSAEDKQLRRHLQRLERRLQRFQEPRVSVTIKEFPPEGKVTVDFRLIPAPRERELISHQAGQNAGQAVRLAVEDIERQLERWFAKMRGEPAYGVPSRREPEELRGQTPEIE
ncbi:MAG TPA: HPF/RaiA family ribosome-associated protein [Thermomicrobiales bacterium]